MFRVLYGRVARVTARAVPSPPLASNRGGPGAGVRGASSRGTSHFDGFPSFSFRDAWVAGVPEP